MKKLFVIVILTLAFVSSSSIHAQDKLKVGNKAPNFTLQDVHGKKYTLDLLCKQSPVVVYFYPKAGTPGCTTEACGIRDDWGKFKENKIQVLGISVDDTKAIKDFIANNHLNFPLLSDADKKVSNEYGVLMDYGMDKRVTFIVDKKGIIADIIDVTYIPGHAEKVLALAAKLK